MTFTYTFCPRCGAPLGERALFGRERRFCRYCGYIQFRDPKVAVGALIEDGDHVLLVRRSFPPSPGLWALPAGFMDHDEMPEDALLREVAEETGLKVRVLGLVGIVPMGGWDEKRGILLVYRAQLAEGELIAADDVSEAAWFAPGEVPWDEIAFETTTSFLQEWVRKHRP